jgi:hypothetical protein
MSSDAAYRVQVRVIDATGQPLPGVRVAAFDQDPRSPDDPLGSASTDERGLAIIRFNGSIFSEHPGERGPDIYFRIFLAGILLSHRLEGRAADDGVLRNFQPRDEAVLIRVTAELPDTKPSLAWVSGTVMDRRGRGRQGYPVRLEQVRPGAASETLGEGVTGAGGRYRILYDRDQAHARHDGGLNLRIALFKGKERLAISPLVRNAPPRVEGLALVVKASELDESSDFERVRRDLFAAAEAAGLDPADLTETAAQPDASLLAGETGHPVEKIALLAASLRLERDSDGQIGAELAYGLGSLGVPFGLVPLAQAPEAQLAEQVALAVERGNVTARAAKQLKTALVFAGNAMKEAGVATLVKTPLGKIAESAAGEDGARRFFDLAADRGDDVEALWRAVERDSALKESAPRLRFALGAAALVGAQPKAVAMLQDLHDGGEINDLTALAAWTVDDWMRRLTDADVDAPGLAEDADDAARKSARLGYARGLDRVVEAMVPTAYARHRIAASTLPGAQAIAAFLDSAEGFHLNANQVGAWVRAHPDASAPLLADPQAMRTLASLSRVARVARRTEPALVLVRDGIGSARDIAASGPAAFATRYGETFGSHTLALTAHAQAGAVALGAAELLLEATAQPANRIAVMPAGGATELPAFPDWATLFGAEDGCACRHCASITGPGAYLVDALEFLRRRSSRSGTNARDVLLRAGRRPDLAEIELTCENTDTVLPYIDLVNEVLEDAVAPLPAFAPAVIAGPLPEAPGGAVINTALRNQMNAALGLTGPNAAFAIGPEATLHGATDGQPLVGAEPSWRVEDRLATYRIRRTAANTLEIASRGRNTRGPSSERLLSPQYVNAQAYQRLAGAFYPWSLPFERPLLEARLGLAAQQTSLVAVLEGFAPGSAPERRARRDVALERLGLGSLDFDLVTWTQTPAGADVQLADPWLHWGFAAASASAADPVPDPADRTTPITAGDWVALLAGRLDLLLDRGQLEMDDVLALLDTHYVNPPRPAGDRRSIALVSTLVDEPATCRPRWLRLDGLNQPGLLRIARLVRLSRRCGLSFRQLDLALTALGAGEPNAVFLDALARCLVLRERLGAQAEADWESLCATLVLLSDPARLTSFWHPTGAARRVDQSEGETRLASTFYEQQFRPGRNPHPSLSWFPPDPAGLTGRDLRDGTAALAAAFGIPGADLTRLLASPRVLVAGPLGLDTAATLPNLARLQRHAWMITRLGLDAEDWLRALDLFDADPFRSAAALADFVATVDQAVSSGLTLAELDWLARHRGTPPGGVDPEADTALLDGLRGALRAVLAEHRFVPADATVEAPTLDPDGSLTRRKLTALGLPTALVEAAVAALSDSAVASVTDPALPIPAVETLLVPSVDATLAALPVGVDVGVLSGGKASFDAAAGRLRTSGKLDDRARQALTDAASDPLWRGALAELFAGQDALVDRAGFDPETHTLRFRGPIAQAWREHLDGLSTLPAWRSAVERLHAGPRRVLRSILRSWPLARVSTPLPGGLPVRLSPTLDGRLYLDRAVSPPLLRMTGPLLDDELALLKAAAPDATADHVAFRAALDQLALALAAAPVAPGGRLIADADLDALLDAPLLAPERYRRLLALVMPQISDSVAEATLHQTLAAGLGLASETVARLTRNEITDTAGAVTRSAAAVLRDPALVESATAMRPSAAAFPAQHRVLARLRKAALLVQRYGLTTADLIHLAGVAAWPRIGQLPVVPLALADAAPVSASALLRLADYQQLRGRIPGGRVTLREIAAAAASGATNDVLLTLLAARLGRPRPEVVLLAGNTLLDMRLSAALDGEQGLLRLLGAFAHSDRLGLPAAALAALRSRPLSADAGRAVIAAVGGDMAPEQWREVGRELFDRVRVAARDALTTYLLARGRSAQGGLSALRWRSTAELFAHYLIDVEMGPCMETSRLRQAMSSLQLWVQRIQLGLEPEVDGDSRTDDGWCQWEWMRNYRVWEANRKIFLWPENLLNPELLDVKSQAFRDFEAGLGQGEVTLESAARAMLGYLEQLKRLAHPRPLAMARQAVQGGEVLHLVATTRGEPAELYYRRRDDLNIWSPWEKVSVDVKSEHVLLHAWNGRIFLWWLDFTLRAENPQFSGSTITATRVFDVRLCWSEWRDGQWSPQRQSRQTIPIGEAKAGADARGVVFRIEQDSDEALWIRWRHSTSTGAPMTGGGSKTAFRIDYPHAEPAVEWRRGFRLPARPIPSALHRTMGQSNTVSGGFPYALQLPHSNDTPAPALRQIRRSVDLVYSPSLALTRWQEGPFLLGDTRRTFFATSTTREVGGILPPVYQQPDDFSQWFDPYRFDLPLEVLPLPLPWPGPLPQPEWDGPLINPVANTWSQGLAISPEVGEPAVMAEDAGWSLRAVRRVFRDDRRLAVGVAGIATQQASAYNNADAGLLAGLGLGGVIEGLSRGGVQTLKLGISNPAMTQVGYGQSPLAEVLLGSGSQSPLYSTIVTIDDAYSKWSWGWGPPRTLRSYRLAPFYHPYTDGLIHVLRSRGLEAMLSRQVQLRPFQFLPQAPPSALDYRATYGSVDAVVSWQHATETLDFDYDGAYSLYNWELFFHAPMLIADRLAKSQRFNEALRWLHLIFDPRDQSSTAVAEDGSLLSDLGAARFWQTKPLFQNTLPRTPGTADSVVERERIERILSVLAAAAAPDASTRLTSDQRADVDRFRLQVEAMRRHPFRPHAIARLRQSAYQRAVVMLYIDVLIQWGDQLFRRDTMETVNAATQLYVLAAELRGEVGQTMPPRALAAPFSYAAISPRLSGLEGDFNNPLVAIEAFVSPSASPDPTATPWLPPPAMLAFCIPANDKLAEYWQRIADRLFKIRHCMNIEGVPRRLALFEPPIDPAVLARAVAAGTDIGAALADLDGPTPTRRFRVAIRQAAELAGEVRSLGTALLAALEKRDSEELTRLRAVHELALVNRTELVRDYQVKEAKASLEALRASRRQTLERYRHYRRLLGQTNLADPQEGDEIPMLAPRTDTATHGAMVFRLLADLISSIPGAGQPPGTDLANIPVNSYEDFELSMLVLSQGFQLRSSAFEVLSGIANIVPNWNIEPWGVGATFGGSNVGAAFSAAGRASSGIAGAVGFAATMAGRAAQYASRADDWILQQNLAAREILQIDRQIIAAQLRQQIAERELFNQQRQAEDAAEYEETLRDKFTNQALYDWMIGRLSELHFQAHQLAYDWAKRAQRAAQIELQRPQMDFIRFGQWDGLRQGLLAGEALAMDIRRLELAFDEHDLREESMVKHVSLARTDPAALVRLRETGSATFAIPEALFDLDCPGQYLRRLKTVAVTIPCVTGPYAGVHARLTLLRSSIRVSSALAGRGRVYARERNRDDPRFTDLVGKPQSIVTSSAQNDSGLFETNLEDPRYLPFEGLGAISEWRLDLPGPFRAFDYASISDLVLHLRYQARDGGQTLRTAVQTELTSALNALESTSAATGLVRRFSLRHEVPTAWQRMLEATQGGLNVIELPIERERLPFFVEGRSVTITRISVLAKISSDHLADYSGGLRGNLIPLGTVPPGEALTFSPWLGNLLQATWEGRIELDTNPMGGNPLRPLPWHLNLQHTPPAGVAGPLSAAAVEDIEILVSYRLG